MEALAMTKTEMEICQPSYTRRLKKPNPKYCSGCAFREDVAGQGSLVKRKDVEKLESGELSFLPTQSSLTEDFCLIDKKTNQQIKLGSRETKLEGDLEKQKLAQENEQLRKQIAELSKFKHESN
ncbi:19809_t:CDS:2 [Entrophospora sp. SA101]|nr:19809_t:CDS:2 [Entrophospora sp. SA101]